MKSAMHSQGYNWLECVLLCLLLPLWYKALRNIMQEASRGSSLICVNFSPHHENVQEIVAAFSDGHIELVDEKCNALSRI